MRVRVLENIDMSCCYFSEGGSFDIQNMPKYHDYLRLVSLIKFTLKLSQLSYKLSLDINIEIDDISGHEEV